MNTIGKGVALLSMSAALAWATATASFAFCGDMVVDAGEECDDGNTVNTDGCTNACNYARCGDGILADSEECDDGNTFNFDGCDSLCAPTASDQCVTAHVFTPPFVGRVLQGTTSSQPSDPLHSCTQSKDFHTMWYSFTAPTAGRFVVDAASFGPYSPAIAVYAGSCGALGPEIGCDMSGGWPRHANVTFDAQPGSTYVIEISSWEEWPYLDPNSYFGLSMGYFDGCGDGNLDAGEFCDDGNEVDTDACHNDCNINGVCGNGVIEGGYETCDDGNTNDGDDCASNCRLPCPIDFCACLGEAQKFTLVANNIQAVQLKQTVPDEEPYFLESAVAGPTCGKTGKFDGEEEAETALEGDVVLTEAEKRAVTLGGFPNAFGAAQPGVLIGGDLVTGGGDVKGFGLAVVDGVLDGTGTHPQVAVCNQAKADVQTASDYFKNLPASQTLPSLTVQNGDEQILTAGDGIHVINIEGDLSVLPARIGGFPEPSVLRIEFGPDTDAVVINIAGDVVLGDECAIFAEGVAGSVVLNVHGDGSKLKLKPDAAIEPAMIMPRGKPISVKQVELSNLYTPSSVKMKGTIISDVLSCPTH